MPVTQSRLILPQFIAAVAAPLNFVNGGNVVPATFSYQILTCNVTNTGGNAGCSLTIWRVPAGTTADVEHIRVPTQVIVPVGSFNNPYFQVTILQGVVLGPGDSVWASAGGSNILSIDADGLVIQ